MLSSKRTKTLRWAGRLGCLVLAGVLVAPPMALARNDRPGRGRNPQVVPRLPGGHQSYVYRGARYYGYGGVYYRPFGRGYVVSRPPRGFFVRALPIGFATLVIAGLTYYTLAGIYYRPAPNGYVVVDPPAGVVVTSPPPPPMVAPSAPQGTAMVTAPLLNVRSGPGYNYPVTATVNQGFNLTVYGQQPGWLYVQTPGGQFGWVAQRFTNMPVVPVPSG
ncbi:MAG: hypothetical protein C4525_14395 [Desulfarculus sp.]|nr:MAG: hypothetical protein C4525_14395 [Desulfarculus sp.]